jgi:uncharacterized SAM-binding protein YcdF (DUF218 family)
MPPSRDAPTGSFPVPPYRPTSDHHAADTGRLPVVGDNPVVRTRRRRRPLAWLVGLLTFALLAPPVLGMALVGAIYIQARLDQTRPVGALVVLGTTQYNGVPQAVLRARLDRALQLYRDGVAQTVIVTGGGQPGDVFTEAEASRDYLIEAGVPERAILLENEGRDSWQSMEAVAGIVRERDIGSVLLVSDGFHLLRLKVMADALGMRAYATAARDSPIRGGQEFGYAVREAFAIAAFVVGHR